MRYRDKRFHVGYGATPEYRDGWERTFGKKKGTPSPEETSTETPVPEGDEGKSTP